MSNFDKYSNYSKDTSFSSVLFGSEKPVLEVELNEMQQILNVKIARVLKALGTKVLFLVKPTGNVSQKKLTLNNTLVFEESGGYVIEIDTATITYSSVLKEIYLRLEEVDVGYADTLHSYGNTGGVAIVNPIKDSRMPGETSRRKCVVYTLMAGETVPTNTDTVKYISIATSDSGGTLKYKDYTTYDSMTTTLLSLAESIEKIKNGGTTVYNSNRLGSKMANEYELSANHRYKTMTQDDLSQYVSKYTTPKALLDEMDEKTILYATVNVVPTWFPQGITALGCVLTVVKLASNRATFTLSSVTNNMQNYYAGFDGTNLTGWVNMTSTAVVLDASVE